MPKAQPLVIDTSVIVKWVNDTNEKFVTQADRLLKDAQNNKIKLLAPELAKYEIGNALLNKKIELFQVKISLTTVYSLPINFISLSLNQASAVMEIAKTYKITFYDAVFIQLAYEFDAVLVTDNPKHQQKFPDVKVVALKNYK